MEKQTRTKEGLVERLLEAGKIILNTEVAEDFGFGWGINYDGYNGIRDTYRHVKHIFSSRKRREVTPEREESLKKLLEGTPFYSIVKEYDAFYQKYGENRETWKKDPLTEFAESVRAGKLSKAFRSVRKPINDSYLKYGGEVQVYPGALVSQFIGRYEGNYYGNGRISDTDALQLTDLNIIAARLAKNLGKNPSRYYELAQLAIKKASCNLGGIVFHFGIKGIEDSLNQASQEVRKREEILTKEGGVEIK